MKKTVRSPGSATIINAIATGFGSAFGIGLDIKCEAKTTNNSISCANDVGADNSLMKLCVEKVFMHYRLSGPFPPHHRSYLQRGRHFPGDRRAFLR